MVRYRIIGPAGEGGAATVSVGQDTNLDRKVAIKSLRPGHQHERVFDELKALQTIRSKHVVEILDVYNDGPNLVLVEEYIEGNRLDDKLGSFRAADNAFVRMVYQAASGLAEVHEVGFIHRDIKPHNLMVDGSGILKIIDFNLSRTDGDAQTTGFVGTRGFAAPEQYSDTHLRFTRAVDLYAFAITAWQLIHGNALPVELRSLPPRPEQWLTTSGGFQSLSGLDRPLAALLDRCFTLTPGERPLASEIRDRAARILSRSRHRALFAHGGRQFVLSSETRQVALSQAGLGMVRIGYDGYDFRAMTVDGAVSANNIDLTPGAVLNGCCVIALGDRTLRPSKRVFITMDVSHPEVVL